MEERARDGVCRESRRLYLCLAAVSLCREEGRECLSLKRLRLATSSCLYIPPSSVCFAFGGIGCSSVFSFSFLSLIGGEEMAPRVVRDRFFWLFLHDKQKNNAKHSLAAIETNTTSILFSLFIRHFFIESRNEKTRGSLWGFFGKYLLLFTYLILHAKGHLSRRKNPESSLSFCFSVFFSHRWSTRKAF